MLKVTAKVEYACLALIELARSPSAAAPLRIRSIADSHGIPENYLVQILIQLKNAGLVASVRGASGGYRLTRPAERINIAQVFEAVLGPEETEPGRSCEPASASSLCLLWERVRAAERAVLDSTTLADLAYLSMPAEWMI